MTGAKFWIDHRLFRTGAGAVRRRSTEPAVSFRIWLPLSARCSRLPFLIRVLDEIFRTAFMALIDGHSGFLSGSRRYLFRPGLPRQTEQAGAMAAVALCGAPPLFCFLSCRGLTESVSASILLPPLDRDPRPRRATFPGHLAQPAVAAFLPGGAVSPLSWAGGNYRRRAGHIPRGTVRRVSAISRLQRLPLPREHLSFRFTEPPWGSASSAERQRPDDHTRLLCGLGPRPGDRTVVESVVRNDEIRARLIDQGEPISYATPDTYSTIWFRPAIPRRRRNSRSRPRHGASHVLIGIVERQLQLPLASIGFQLAAACCLARP